MLLLFFVFDNDVLYICLKKEWFDGCSVLSDQLSMMDTEREMNSFSFPFYPLGKRVLYFSGRGASMVSAMDRDPGIEN